MTEQPIITPTAPTDHHEFSPSKLPAWSECPCFDSDQSDDDDNTTAKSRGKLQHEAGAKAMLGMPDAFAGLTDAEADEARWYAEKAVEICQGAGYSTSEMKLEQRLTMLNPDFSVLYFGTSDVEFGPFLLDAKFGDEHNYFAQMAGYALAKMARDDIDSVMVRVLYARTKRVVAYTITKETAERVVYGILAKRQSPVRRPQVCFACGWCAHKTTCSAINAVPAEIANRRNDWMMKLPTAHVSQAPNDPVTIGALRYMWKAYIEPWGKSVEYASSMMTDNGLTPLGFDVREQKGRAEFTDGVGKAMYDAGISLEILLAAGEFSMTALTEAYHAQFGGTKKAAGEEVEEILLKAGAMKRGTEKTKVLIRRKDAEELIALALARPVAPTISTSTKDLS